MNELPVIVVVDHQGISSRELRDHLSDHATIVAVTSIEEAELAMIRKPADVLICRDDLPKETGLMFLTRHRETLPWQKRILLCPTLDGELAMTLINKTNVFRCLAFPTEEGLLVQAAEAALHDAAHIKDLFTSREENRELRQQLAEARHAPPTTFIAGVRALPRVLMLALFTCGTIFVLGLITLLALYLAKSVLGIDIFPDAHLSDALSD